MTCLFNRAAAVTAVVTFAASTAFTPALGQSSWASVGEATDGTRHFVQKHNWRGRYRVFGSISIDTAGKKIQLMRVADCGSWTYRFYDSTKWYAVLEGTMGDAELRYVCK